MNYQSHCNKLWDRITLHNNIRKTLLSFPLQFEVEREQFHEQTSTSQPSVVLVPAFYPVLVKLNPISEKY